MQPCNPNAKLETKCLHAGYTPKNGGPGTVPIVQSTTYRFDSTEKVAELFDMPMEPMYSRFANPTCDAVEQKIAALEGGVGAMLTSSGQAASLLSVLNLCSAGDSIVSVSTIYGGTVNLFGVTLKRFGIECIWVDPLADEETISQAIKPNTKLIFGETIANPALTVFDIEKFAKIAHAHQIPLIVDNTFATPILCRPIEFGADIVIHSTTKYMDGHALQCGGVIVDGGTFDWTDSRFSLYVEPDASYHYLRWGYDLPEGYPPFITRMRLVPLRNLGACIAPDNAWMILQGLETLPLRMERHCANALKVAYHLKQHPKVAWVRYPGLPDDPAHAAACRMLRNGFGGMVVFGIQGGQPAGQRFIEKLGLFSHLANVGDAKSLALHPASTSHAQLSEEQQRDAGLPPELIRLSIGIEHIDDILEDLDQALGEI